MQPRLLWLRKGWRLYLLLLPPVIYLVLFKYVPMYGVLIAFERYNVVKGIGGSEWVGLKHFQQFFHSYEFWRVLRNTLGLSVYQLIAGFPFPILLALCFNYIRNQYYKKVSQMIVYIPHFISIVVVSGMIVQFLSLRSGLANKILNLFGVASIDFMGRADLFKSIFVWSDIWQNVGFSCIIYLAALTGVDPQLHEAAVVDGANKWRRVWHIDIPTILPIAIILLILNSGHILDTGFEKVLLLQNPLNLSSSEVIDTYVYQVGIASGIPNFSYSTAIGLFKSVISLIILIIVNSIAKKSGQTSLW